MVQQQFDTVDVVRLEVETDPTGLANLIQNPNGELGGWGWITPVAGSAMEAVTAGLRFSGVAGASYFTSEAMPVTAGQYVAARLSGLGGVGVTHVRVRFEWLDLDGVLLSSSAQSAYLPVVSANVQYGPLVAPASTVFVRLRVDLYASNTGTNPAGAHSFTFDQVTVAKAASTGEFNRVRTNLVPNPSFEDGTTIGWVAGPQTWITPYAGPPAPWVGGRLLALGVESGAPAALSAQTAPGTAGMPVTPGLGYGFRAMLLIPWDAEQSRTGLVSVRWYNASGALIIETKPIPQPAVEPDAWQLFEAGGLIAPPSAAYAAIHVSVSTTPTQDSAFVDGFLFERTNSTPDAYFDGSTPDALGWDYAWTGTPNQSPSTATLNGLSYIPPTEYLNVLPDSHTIRVSRSELNAGHLDATILSSALDPSQSTLIRPGRRARLTALVDGQWETVIGGKLLEANVTYEVKNPAVPDEKRARIEVTIVDPAQTLANTGRPEGVATIDELPYVLEGAGVPWCVNGSGNQVPAADVTTYNEGAKALDQVALTRDTRIGYAWMNRVGVLNVWDRDQIASGSPVLLDEDDYSDIDLSYSTKDCINEVQITVQSLGADGTTTETVYGPYVDGASIVEWGRYRKEFTVTGLDSTEVDALAAAILAAAATPRIRVNSLTIPLNTIARVEAHALRDLYDEVRVVLTSLGIDEVLRVTGLEHTIATSKWMLRLDFSDEGGVASPTVQPPVQSGIRPDVGVIELFAGSTPPAGKLLCDGTSYPVADYPHLFAVIGYTFGGSGAFFNVPDLTDRFPIGSGTKALGTTGGSPTKPIPAHTHGIPGQSPATARTWASGTSSTNAPALGNYDGHNHGGSTSGTSGSAFDVMNPWISLNFVIRAA
ncbi:phage tail protein [Nocardioides sp. J54]|uniref:phage tail protein n=1 Tax=Nocardioides sp. J54 TaxID=935866 RepID=UPI0004B162A1|nr:tail fiber protein [Nocardioides sp. J54]